MRCLSHNCTAVGLSITSGIYPGYHGADVGRCSLPWIMPLKSAQTTEAGVFLLHAPWMLTAAAVAHNKETLLLAPDVPMCADV